MIWYVIPAREGSKGLPGKNRRLFAQTAETVKNMPENVLVTTDDEEIKLLATMFGFRVIDRPHHLASDTANVRDVLIHAAEAGGLNPHDIMVLLYLTYPERTAYDIAEGLRFFMYNQAESMLCRIDPITHPYMCMYDDGLRGEQVVGHDFFRRQDYPPVFEIRHFLGVFRVGVLPCLNKNLYNKETLFWKRPRTVDVDTKEDIDKLCV